MTTQTVRYDYSGVASLLPVPWDAPFSIFSMELEATLKSIQGQLADDGTPMSDVDVQDLRDEVYKRRTKWMEATP